MKRLFAYLKRTASSPLYFRVCMFLWGLPFAAGGVYMLAVWRPGDAVEWIGFALLGVVGFVGAWLVYVATLGSQAAVDRASGFVHEGSDALGAGLLFAVAIVAIPLTALLEAFRRGE